MKWVFFDDIGANKRCHAMPFLTILFIGANENASKGIKRYFYEIFPV